MLGTRIFQMVTMKFNAPRMEEVPYQHNGQNPHGLGGIGGDQLRGG
jgi:dUTPase